MRSLLRIDVPDWGPSLPYGALVEGYRALQPSAWEVRRDIVEEPITPEYGEYLALHPPPWITILDEPAPVPAAVPVVAPAAAPAAAPAVALAGGIQVGQRRGREEDVDVDVESSSETDSDDSSDSSEDSSDDDGGDGRGPSVAGLLEPSSSVPRKRQAVTSSSADPSEVAGLQVQVQTLQGQLAQLQGLLAQTQAQTQAQLATAQTQITSLISERDGALQAAATAQAQVTRLRAQLSTAQAQIAALTAERDTIRRTAETAQATTERLQRVTDGTSVADYMREAMRAGAEIEFYRSRYHELCPPEQRVIYAQSRSGRSRSRTVSRGVTQPLPRDLRDLGTSGGGTDTGVRPAPSGGSTT